MKRIWKYISYLGTDKDNRQQISRAIILSNQLNFIMLLTAFLLLAVTIITQKFTHDTLYFGTLRVAITMGLNLLNLLLAMAGFTRLSRLSLIFLPPVVFLLGPTLIGYVEEEGYTYYPYVLIALSVIPQLLLDQKNEKILLWISLLFYFLLVVFIDTIMVSFGEVYFPIIDRIKTFYPYYKLAHITIFFFINSNIYYLKILNFRFESELDLQNRKLDIQNQELKEQKEEIKRQKDELLNKEIETWQNLFRIISHEIKNSAIPITNLAGITKQMLEDESGNILKPDRIGEDVSRDIHHSLKVIESRTGALINFVNATRSLTQLPETNIRRILIKELFDRITALFQARFREEGLSCITKVEPEDLSVEADLELVEHVIINLIINSLEAMQASTEPQLSLKAISDISGRVRISVSDNGPGIADEMIDKIFLPFFSTKASNTGIGLSLSKQIMMLHNGRIEVTNNPASGCTFNLIF